METNKGWFKKGCVPVNKFEKGHVPWNKGKKGYMGANKTSFKKGDKPHNYKPVGTIAFKGKNLHIKISDPNKWELLNRYKYKEYHNIDLTSNDIIIFLNGDIEDFSKENLYKITRGELVIMNKNKIKDIEDKELRRSATLSALLYARSMLKK